MGNFGEDSFLEKNLDCLEYFFPFSLVSRAVLDI